MSLRDRLRRLLDELRGAGRAAVLTYLALLGLASLLLAPLTAWLLDALLRLGDVVVTSNQGLADFFLSPIGLLWSALTGASIALVPMLQQACMTELWHRPRSSALGDAAATLLATARRLPALLGVLLVQVTSHSLVLVLGGLCIAGLADALLVGDLATGLRAPGDVERIAFLGSVLPLAAAMLLGHAWLLLRWALAIPLVVLERRGTRSALARSARLVAGTGLPRRGSLLLTAIVLLALPVVVSTGFASVAPSALNALPATPRLVVPAAAVALALALILTLGAGFLGIALHALNVLRVYGISVDAPATRGAAPAPRHPGIAAGLEAALVAAALGYALNTLQAVDAPPSPSITAHRGASEVAPENTLAAVRAGIAAGAQMIEVDVRRTADGALVLMHDATLSRTAGVDRPVTGMSLEELRELEVGSWFDPAFRGEPIPTLAETVRAVRGRAELYVDLKPNPLSPGLVDAVIEELRRLDFLDRSVIASTEPAVLARAREQAPGVRTTRFVQFLLGPLDRSGFDALGLRHNRIDAAALAAARYHGHALHAWTVNRDHDLGRMLTLGVDNIITDRPAELGALRAEHATVGPLQRILLNLRYRLLH